MVLHPSYMRLPHPGVVVVGERKYESTLKMKSYDNLVPLLCLQLAECFTSPLKFHTSLHLLPGGITSYAMLGTIIKY